MAAAAPTASRRWLFGPAPDLLLGCGVAYAAVFATLWLAGPTLRAWIPIGLAPLVALLSATPHYGATLLRVYGRREDRRAYVLFAVWASLMVAGAFVWGLSNAFVGSFLLTLYLTWSPWHYTGQNYGVALMLLGRRGAAPDRRTKRFIYASFLLSFVLTAVSIHAAVPGADYAPVGYRGTSYQLLPLGIPAGWLLPLLGALGAAYLVATGVAGFRLLRRATLADVAPAALVVATQALWFSVPVAARNLGWGQGIEPLSVEHAAYAFLWVAAGHSLQYLWVTTYYARASGRWRGYGRYWIGCLLAGAGIWVAPALLFAPQLLGRVPFDAGLEVLVAACVNIHHFILDGAIWKLRDGRVARVLLRAGQDEDAGAEAPAWAARLARPALGAVGLLSVAVLLFGTLEDEFGFRRALARGDLERAQRAVQRLTWMGRESTEGHAAAALLAARQGELETARQHLERGRELHPTPEGWRIQAWLHEMAGEHNAAIGAYREALALRPGWTTVQNNLAWLHASHPNPLLRNAPEATRLAQAAVAATGGRDPAALDTLGVALAAAGRFEAARRAAESAITLARESGAEASELAAMERRLAGYERRTGFVVSADQLARAARDAPVELVVLDTQGQAVQSVELSH